MKEMQGKHSAQKSENVREMSDIALIITAEQALAELVARGNDFLFKALEQVTAYKQEWYRLKQIRDDLMKTMGGDKDEG